MVRLWHIILKHLTNKLCKATSTQKASSKKNHACRYVIFFLTERENTITKSINKGRSSKSANFTERKKLTVNDS